jgi:hypothetical protein
MRHQAAGCWDDFVEGRAPVHDSLRRLVQGFDQAGMGYAIVGAMAVIAHGHRRGTDNVDVLVTPQGLVEFRDTLVPECYVPVERHTRRFTDRINQIPVNFFLTGHHPGWDYRGPVTFPEPRNARVLKGDVWHVTLETLLSLKLAARRFQDLADVVGLAAVHELDNSYAERLHPSIREDYLGCIVEIPWQEEPQEAVETSR